MEGSSDEGKEGLGLEGCGTGGMLDNVDMKGTGKEG